MKKHPILKKVFLLTLLLLILSSFFLVSCENNEKLEKELENHTKNVLDAVINGDRDTAWELLSNICTEDEFDEFFSNMQELFADSKSYTLEKLGDKISYEQSVTVYSASYKATTDSGNIYAINCTVSDSIDGLYEFHIGKYSTVEENTSTILPIQILLKLSSLAVIVISVYLIVDCAKRNIKYKPLFIVLLFFSVPITVITSSSGVKLTIALNLVCKFSDLSIINDIKTLTLVIPVGMIIYLCLRKKLTAPPLATEKDSETKAEETPIENDSLDSTEKDGEPLEKNSADNGTDETPQ